MDERPARRNVGLILYEHNWLHPHIALRVRLPEPQEGRIYQQRTPAMALRLTNHQWTWQESLLFRVMPF
jgi:hypothetical protein